MLLIYYSCYKILRRDIGRPVNDRQELQILSKDVVLAPLNSTQLNFMKSLVLEHLHLFAIIKAYQ